MSHPLLLNLGSGPRTARGWVSIDGSWNAWLAQRPRLARLASSLGLLTEHHLSIGWPPDGILCRDVRRGLPYPDGSVDGIYAAHFLEHLEPWEAARLLSECRRVLAWGAAVRVIVPDLETLARQYLDTPEGPARAQAASHFLATLNLALLRQWPAGWRWRLARLVSRAGHRAVHDRHSLAALLAQAGFSEIELRGPCASRIPLIERVETPDRHEASVCLEAVKR